MNPPIPPPRKNFKRGSSGHPPSGLFSKGSRPQSGKRSELVHAAEVHSSKSRLLSSTDEEMAVEESVQQKRRKKLRKRQNIQIVKEVSGSLAKKVSTSNDEIERMSDESAKTVIISRPKSIPICEERRGSLTETLSEDSNRSHGSNRIRLVPILKSHRKKPSGSATETLSEEEPSSVVKKSSDNHFKTKTGKSVETLNSTTDTTLNEKRDKDVDSSKESLDKLNCENEEMNTKEVNETIIPIPLPRKKSQKVTQFLNQMNKELSEESFSNNTPSLSSPTQGQEILIEKVNQAEKIEEDVNMETHENDSSSESEEPGKLLQKQINSETRENDDIVCITFHGCDAVCANKLGKKPVVRVHTIDIVNAKYKDSSTVEDTEVLPVTTQPCNNTIHRDMRVHWETEVFICESVISLAMPEVVLFFEVIDIDSANEKCKAWAFLKLVGSNGAVNIRRLLRLQLFKPPRLSSKNKTSLPSSINKTELKPIKWNRYPTQMCKLPNKKVYSLDAGSDGCLCLEYSHSGLLLACPTKQNIILYTFDGEIYLILMGHEGLVYCIKWSRNDKYLMSASADSTVCIWNVEARNPYPELVLSHPSYVYSCCWLGSDESVRGAIVATGCFDTDIRLWKLDNPKGPVQFLSLHQSRVNSIVAIETPDGESCKLISGDAEGTIIIWTRENGLFSVERELKLNELNRKVINKLYPHPGGKRLLVHTRDNLLRMLDLQTGAVIQWYQGGVNRRLRMESVLCGCGSKVLACSEDNTVCVWETDTGNQLAVYHGLNPSSSSVPITALAFHPHDHTMAIASHSTNNYPSVFVVRYDKNENGQSVGLVLMDNVEYNNKINCTSVGNIKRPESEPADRRVCQNKDETSKLNRRHKESVSGSGGGGFLGSLLGLKKKAVNGVRSRSSSAKGKRNKGFVDEDGDATPQENFFSKGGVGFPAQASDLTVKRESNTMTGSNSRKNLGLSSDIRLADIIYQMDRILISASPNSAS